MLLPSTSQCLLCRGGAFPCRPGGNSKGMDGLGREGQGWNPLLILHSQKCGENPTWTGRVNGFRGRGVGCVVWEWVLRAEGLKRSPVSKESGDSHLDPGSPRVAFLCSSLMEATRIHPGQPISLHGRSHHPLLPGVTCRHPQFYPIIPGVILSFPVTSYLPPDYIPLSALIFSLFLPFYPIPPPVYPIIPLFLSHSPQLYPNAPGFRPSWGPRDRRSHSLSCCQACSL